MSPRQLNELANRLGRGKIVVCHGGADKMIPVQHADVLLQGLNGERPAEEDEARKQIWPDLGHGLLLEGAEALKRLIEDTIRKTEVNTLKLELDRVNSKNIDLPDSSNKNNSHEVGLHHQVIKSVDI